MIQERVPIEYLPGAVLVAFRDALSATLECSITFADLQGKNVRLDRTQVGRRYVAKVCQEFHFKRGSPLREKCLNWDRDAAQALCNEPEKIYLKQCHMKFECFGVGIPHTRGRSGLGGIILGGERRVEGTYESERKLALEILKKKWPGFVPQKYDELHAKSITENLIDEAKFREAAGRARQFAVFLGSLLDREVFLKNQKPSQTMEAIGDILKEKPDCLTALEIVAAGLRESNQWLWEFIDPFLRDPRSAWPKPEIMYVLFGDIRDYTVLCKEYGVEYVAGARDRLFGQVIDVVQRHNGIIDKFIGDAFLAYFLRDDEEEESEKNWASRTLQCALDILEIPTVYCREEERLGPLHLGLGISKGEVIFGHREISPPGEEEQSARFKRREITAIGTPVNKAQRLCGTARKFGAVAPFEHSPSILFDEEVKLQLPPSDLYEIIELDAVRLKGFSSSGRDVYEPVYTAVLASGNSPRTPLRFVSLAYGFLSSPPNRVVDAHADYYYEIRKTGLATDRIYPEKDVADLVAKALSCDPQSIGFRANTTHAIESALVAAREKIYQEGKSPCLLTTDLEHPAVLHLAQTLFSGSQHKILTLRAQILEIQSKKRNDPYREVEDLLFRTFDDLQNCNIALFSHITWDLGFVLPYFLLSQRMRKLNKDIYIIIDGAHSFGHLEITLKPRGDPNVPFDFFATCGHKWIEGPQGTGILFANHRIVGDDYFSQRLAAMDTLTHQAGMGALVKAAQQGTEERAKAYGLSRAVRDYVDGRKTYGGVGIEQTIRQKAQFLFTALEESEIPQLRILSPQPLGRLGCGIVTFQVGGNHGELYEGLDESLHRAGFLVTHVSANQSHAIRLCVSYRTKQTDLERFVSALRKAVQEISPNLVLP
jgi:selenocysteine lyase/cysteine desulfurase/class 3 adenylate cyclase